MPNYFDGSAPLPNCLPNRAVFALLRRVWPERKGRPVALDLPPLESAADLARALGAIAQAVATGEMTPEEGQAVASVLEVQRRALETVNLEQRIEALEARGGNL
jgi:hypothetical protein